MAKKNAGKVIQMLSPENYIRKKATSLPIYECLVNPEWQEQGFANLVIARSHTNGNITACIYLVDLYCLGVKDTHYLFNSTRSNYQEKFGGNDKMNFKPISYILAHNIVYAGLEFAEEYGFKPHKDFTSITRFMLEEDTEDVELIDIECGKDGKPFYVSGPYDDDLKIRKIIAQLEKTAGAGNYDYILPGSDDEFDEFDDDGEDEDDEFKGLSIEEKKKIFDEFAWKKNKPNEEDTSRYLKLVGSIFKDFTDSELIDKYYDEFHDDLNILLCDDEIPDEMLGIVPGSARISDETRSMFLEINDLAHEEPKKASKLLEKFRKQTPDIPASYYLELLILLEKESKNYPQKLTEYAYRFPDYALIRILWLENEISKEIVQEQYPEKTYDLDFFFSGRISLHVQEMLNYLIFKLSLLSMQDDASRLEALYLAYDETGLHEDSLKILDSLVLMAKMRFIFKHLK